MTKPSYRSGPVATKSMPPGIPYIVGNECAERFSFYGMRAILYAYMTQHLVNAAGEPAPMSEAQASAAYHAFVAAAYFFPFVGALCADVFLGKYRTIILFSLVYCLGHFLLALTDTPLWKSMLEPRWGLYAGLSLIAVGAGCIKGCVSAHVGDQFGKSNQNLLSKVFGWFYLSINLGSVVSIWLTPLLLKHLGPQWAFGVPGILMVLATLVFWMGRWKFAHIPPGGWRFVRDSLSREGLLAAGRLTVLYFFVAMFWCLFDQTGARWVEQAYAMDRRVNLSWLGALGIPERFQHFELEPSQVQAANPFLVLVMIPLFSYVIYPAAEMLVRVTPLRKIGCGLFLTAFSFAVCGLAQSRIDGNLPTHIAWQLLAYVLLTAGEVLVSITGLEFSYTQAPTRMKSFIMALWFLAVSLGNELARFVNSLIDREVISLKGASYYWLFAAAMLATAVIYLVASPFYKGTTYVQQEQPVS